MKTHLFQSGIMAGVVVLSVLLGFQAAVYGHSIPHADALNSAAVIQSSINNVDSKAIIIGNGDINALMFSQNSQITMHLSKNDVWDARLITENDPPLLQADIFNHSWSGGSRPPSWFLPCPTPTPAYVIKIDFSGNITNTNLDLRRGVATIVTSCETITIRALMHINVIAIEAEGAVSIEGFSQKFLPGAENGRSGNQQFVKQTIPGDIDVPGMDVYGVKVSDSNLHAVSVAHTRETKLAKDTATAIASKVIGTLFSTTVRLHESVWLDFWSKSGVQLADQDFQNWWYRQLYYLRCLSKPDGFPIALQGGYNKDNSVVMLNVARARPSMTDDAINDTKTFFKGQEQGNGLFHWKGHGYYMSEQTAVAGLINEFLLHSADGIIRIFPAWPKDKDAAFTRLRAQGGFLVSAVQEAGKIKSLEVESTVSGILRLMNPWSHIRVKTGTRVWRLQPDAQGVVTLAAKAGEKLVFTDDVQVQSYEPAWESLLNYEAPEWYEDAKLGFWVRWGVYSVPAFMGDHAGEWYDRWMYCREGQSSRHDQGLATHQHHLRTYGDPGESGYKEFLPLWKAEKYDPEAWVDLCVAGGGRFFCTLAVFHGAFCLWDPKLTKMEVRQHGTAT